MTKVPYRLDDWAVRDFIVDGYLTLEPILSPQFHRQVHADIERIHREQRNVGNRIYEEVDALREVFEQDQVKGTLQCLLGDDMVMHVHRHCHTTSPDSRQSGWHQDDVNVRHHQVRRLLVMYYPQAVLAQMGPTVVLPGTHFRNAPSARMASYGNFKGQKALLVPAGTVVVAHYDLWHSASSNRSQLNRHMLKFVFDRVSDPTEPSWNHDPDNDLQVHRDFTHIRYGHDSNSDQYKLVAIRHKVWNWMKSGSFTPRPGASEETVISYYQ